MTDSPWKRDEPQSPCKKICVMHPDARLCIGCYRTIDEIRDWSQLGKDARIALMKTLPERARLLKTGRRGGRRGKLRQTER